MTPDTIGDCEVVTSLAPEAAPPPCDAPAQLAGHPHLGYTSSSQFVGISLQITLVQAVGKVVSVLLGFLPARAESSKSGAILRGEVSAVGFNSLGRSYLKPK